MRITGVNSRINFCRELNSEEIKEFSSVRDEAKQLTGQTGKSIFIVHDACLPQSNNVNTGISNLSFKDSQDFFAYMKQYLGFNTVEILPAGQVSSNNGLYCAYSGSALSLGNHQINPELLTQKEYYNLLTKKEFQKIVNSNTTPDKETIANYKNVMDDNSPQDKALRIAYKRFKKLKNDNPLKIEFMDFSQSNNDWLEPKGIYSVLAKKYGESNYKKWTNDIDINLYNDYFDNAAHKQRIKQLLDENSDEIEFFKFKQFLADKHLKFGREKLNEMGVKLTGDCQIGFSADEVWAHPNAFLYDCLIGDRSWNLPSLNYYTITDPNSESAKLLKRKVQLSAQRYDSIRFDVGWAYVTPRIFKPDGNAYTLYMGDEILKSIENTVKEVKGSDYDLKDLIYEFEGGDIFKQNSQDLLEPLVNRVKIYGNTYMQDYPILWGSNDAFLKLGWQPDEFVIGVGNHDAQPLRQIANNIPNKSTPFSDCPKNASISPLARILGLEENRLIDPVEFAKAKWAEPMMAKNNQMFYMDVFGREESFDMHYYNTTIHPHKNYAYKIPQNYKKEYHRAVQEGFGFNIMDSLEKVFKAKGLDRTNPELYSKILKFRDILNEKEHSDKVIVSSGKKVKNNRIIKYILAGGIILASIIYAVRFMLKNSAISQKLQSKN